MKKTKVHDALVDHDEEHFFPREEIVGNDLSAAIEATRSHIEQAFKGHKKIVARIKAAENA